MGIVRYVEARTGLVGPGMARQAWQGLAGWARHGCARLGLALLGMAWHGAVSQV